MLETNHKEKTFTFGYLRSLDGLRGVAVLAVLILHAFIPFTVADNIKIIGVGGFLGVDIFFVLSGFLITSLLVQEWETIGWVDFKKFYARRALRLLPALFVFVGFCVLHSILFRASEESSGSLSDVFVIAFYLSNWIPINLYSLRHTWSLAVEEQFYLFYPVFLLILLSASKRFRISRERIIFVLLFLIAAIAVYRAVFFAQNGFSMRIYIGSDTRFDSLLVGCLVGLLLSSDLFPAKVWFANLMKIIALGATVAFFYMFLMIKYDDSFLYYGGFTGIAFFVGAVIVSLQISPPKVLKFILEWSVLVWVGRLSYGIYLWHKLVYLILDSLLPMISIRFYTMQRIVAPFTFKLVCSLAVAAISYYALEKPFLNLKKHFVVVSSDNKSEFLKLSSEGFTEEDVDEKIFNTV